MKKLNKKEVEATFEQARLAAEAKAKAEKPRGYIKSLMLYTTVLAIAATALDFAYRLYQSYNSNDLSSTMMGNAFESTKQDGLYVLNYLINGICAIGATTYQAACEAAPVYCDQAKGYLASGIDYANTTVLTPFCNRMMNAPNTAGQAI